ncbi:aminodeoxychorismate lyase [Shewanella waksmanii]|uniref:aminodeoxychorismate lyase n=1 Tax=Shewanella waksmanii TaxID=213783 RepID=UPI0037354339
MLWVNRQLSHHIAATDRGLAYGDGVFATMRFNQHGPLFVDTHLARLAQSCQRLSIDWQASAELTDFLVKICQQAYQDFGQDGCLKVLLSRGSGGRGYQAPQVASLTEVVSIHPIPAHYAQWQQQGINLSVSDFSLARQPRLAGMKHLNRLEQVLIRQQPLPQDCDDVVVCDTQGWVTETAIANLFIVTNDRVYTPCLAHAGVAGVMRQQIICTLAQQGYSVEATQIDRARLLQAESVFISNSLFGIIDINRIDDKLYQRASFTETLRSALNLQL